MLRYIAFNPEVLQILKIRKDLYLLWTLGHRIDPVDPDIDPTHNPMWVESRYQREENLLELLKHEVEEANKKWEELSTIDASESSRTRAG